MERKYQYSIIYEDIKEKIESGFYKTGDLLPAEPELEKIFNVSRTTVRKAVDLLSREGYLKAQQGKGTIVTDNKTIQFLNFVTSVSETLRNKGYETSLKNVYVDTTPADSFMSEKLGIEEGEIVARVQRIQMANNSPVAILRNYIPRKFVLDIARKKDKITSFYIFLEKEYGIYIDAATEIMSAKNATFEEAEMLKVPVGCALIDLKRICYSNNVPICVDYSLLIGSKYEFAINMIGRKK